MASRGIAPPISSEPLFFFSSRRRHTRWNCDWSSDVCSSDLRGIGGRVAEQHGIAAVQPDRELAGPGRLHQQPRVLGIGGGVGHGGFRCQQVPDPLGYLGACDHQVGLAEQGGGTHRQQPFVARARADEGDPARGRLRRRTACWLVCHRYGVHLSSSPLLMCPSDTAMYRPAPRRSNSAATSRPRLLASAAGPPALARSTVPPLAATTTACSRNVCVPAAYAPIGALQPAARAASTLRSAVVAALLTGSSAQASRLASSGRPALHSTASAPWPAAGSISSGSKTWLTASRRPIRARPA